MFIRLYILSFLRNILIFLVITPALYLYVLTLVYRVPNLDREKLLSYISETNDMTYLQTPFKKYHYFFALVEDDEIKFFDGPSEPSDLVTEIRFTLERSIAVYHNEKLEKVKVFNVYSEDRKFDHGPGLSGKYYFSTMRAYDPVSQCDIYHGIYTDEDYSNPYILQQAKQANYLAMIAASIISLFFAFLEVRPTKIAWNNQKRYIANASHELRTPLAVISSVLEQDDVIIGTKKGIIDNEMMLLKSIVSGMMFLSRVDAKQIKINKTENDIYTLLLETYIAAEVLAAKKRIQFDDFICDNIIAYIDDTLIRQLVQILLNNAIEYTPEGGRIAMTCRITGLCFEISVKDNGIGIEKKHKRLIFTRFFRVDKSMTSNKGNSGLGLAIAKWIVKKHHGSISVQSEAGKGSVFIVKLPIKRRLFKRGDNAYYK